jgi:hypothetical protein
MEPDKEARTLALEGIGLIHEALNNNAPLVRKDCEVFQRFLSYVVKFKYNETETVTISYTKEIKQ